MNPFNTVAASANATIASPTTGASSAFGLGSGAFASFGSANKAPKTPTASASTESPPTNGIADTKGGAGDAHHVKAKASSSSLGATKSLAPSAPGSTAPEHPTKHSWVVWYRPPTAKHLDYEKSTIALASFGSAEAFWAVYAHLKRPSALPAVSDYHLFRRGVRPVWEDEANKRGGKWIVRLKKGVADRFWEDLLLAIVGDQFGDAGEEVCGAVLSVRSGEDVLSVWTRINGGRNIKIRWVDSMRRFSRCLGLTLSSARPSSASWHSHPTPTSCGRAMTIASPNAPHSIRRGRRRRMGMALTAVNVAIRWWKIRRLKRPGTRLVVRGHETQRVRPVRYT